MKECAKVFRAKFGPTPTSEIPLPPQHEHPPAVTLAEVDELIKSGVIVGGMIPKVNSCLEALKGGGVNKTHIVDARLPHALLLEFFTDQGVGTQIIKV